MQTTSLKPVAKSLLCYYANPSDQLQIIRITNIPSYGFERVIFPGQRILFDAVAKAVLEVHTSDYVQHIHCNCLQIGSGSTADAMAD